MNATKDLLCLGLGGENLFKGELEDAGIHPCPRDPAFKALLQRLWEGKQIEGFPEDTVTPPSKP